MKRIYKTIVVATICLGISSGYTYCNSASRGDMTDLKCENEELINIIDGRGLTTAKVAPKANVKGSPNDKGRAVVPISADLVIYNSHGNESYPSGMKVTDVGNKINDKLIKEGLKSSFIKCNAPSEYVKSYNNSRDLMIKTVKSYKNSTLLDIHRGVSDKKKQSTKNIEIVLAKNNPHYEANKKFADLLVKEIKKSKDVQVDLVEYKKGYLCFNQDLSNKAILIEVGNDKSSNSDVEKCVDVLSVALKNVEKNKK